MPRSGMGEGRAHVARASSSAGRLPARSHEHSFGFTACSLLWEGSPATLDFGPAVGGALSAVVGLCGGLIQLYHIGYSMLNVKKVKSQDQKRNVLYKITVFR